jgi:hypothetical protein
VATRFVSGSIGDTVWADDDRDGVQGDEPGVADLRLVLTGVDDRGADVERETSTDEEGHYSFDGLRPGTYLLDAGEADHVWTTPHQGDDPRRDSDVDEDGRVTVGIDRIDDADGSLLDVTSTEDVDAGLVVEAPVDPPVIDPPITYPPGDAGPGEVDDGPTSGDGAGTEASDPRPDPSSTRLAFTGVSAALLAAGLVSGVALLALGTLMVRRRRPLE